MSIEKKGEEWEEYNNAVKWMTVTVLLAFGITIVLAIISMPLGYLIGSGISKATINDVGRFIQTIFNNPDYLFSRYWSWFKQLMRYNGSFSFSLWLPILPFLSFPTILIAGTIMNPYRFQSNIHGSARLAELKDIKKWDFWTVSVRLSAATKATFSNCRKLCPPCAARLREPVKPSASLCLPFSTLRE